MVTTSGGGPISIYAADLDGDGDKDVLSASSGDDKIAWYENLNSGGVSSTQNVITTAVDGGQSVYAADLDGDGDRDVLSASEVDNKIAWYENLNSGGVSSTQNVITTSAEGAQSVYAADLDGDGDRDVLSASEVDNKIAWYENLDNGGVSSTQNVITTSAGGAQSVYAADLDGDGDRDVLSASSGDDKIAWYENLNSGGVSSTQNVITTGADRAQSVYAADVDGDSDKDALSASEFDGKIAWYENLNGGGVSSTQNVIATNADWAQSVHAADVDGDADLDILSASQIDDEIAWHENRIDQDEGFPKSRPINLIPDANSPRSIHAADLDGDEDRDVLFASFSDDKIGWYENLNSGGVSTSQTVITTKTDGARSVHAADLDGDTDKDVLFAAQEGNKLGWYENLNSGGISTTQTVITTSIDDPKSVYTADLDGDGDKDVLSASSDKVVWYENLDSGGVSTSQTVITTSVIFVQSVYVADLDGDGDGDVLSASSDKVVWYENLDSGGVSTSQTVITTSADRPQSVYAADLDGDGDKDVLSASSGDDKIAWYENLNNGGVSSTQNVVTTNANGAESVYAADLDGDGDKDVLSASTADDKVAWYENFDDGGVSTVQRIITTRADGAFSVHAADLDEDADNDILSVSSSDDKIAWYENTDSSLPVELTSFEARRDGTKIRLTWQTASETANAGFYVQRQGPSQEKWTRLGFVDGAGTTSHPQSYQFEAEDLPPGTHKFRLRQADTDGTAHITRVISTEIQMQKKARLTAPAPNPITTTAQLTFAVKDSKRATVTLYNTLGQRVATLYEGRPMPGEQVSLQLDASALESGAYWVRLRVGDVQKTRKITVVK